MYFQIVLNKFFFVEYVTDNMNDLKILVAY